MQDNMDNVLCKAYLFETVRLKQPYRGYGLGVVTHIEDGIFTLRIPNFNGYRLEGVTEEDIKGIYEEPSN